jgi:coenzyme F420-reducing hydrogenase alpha subunit
VSNKGLDISIRDYDEHFIEEQVPYSNALHSRIKERSAYIVGPLARYNLNFGRLSPLAQEAARSAGLEAVCRNPYRSIIVRSVEVLYACEEALRIIDRLEVPDNTAVEIEPRVGTGYGCTEAPRGILYHRFRISDQGLILDAKIVPPTSQNQKTIEGDLWQIVPARLKCPEDELATQCEHAVRNYDPCISCATHFLKLHIDS